MSFLFLRLFSFRHWRARPGPSVLLVLILALGIAVYFSIRLANRAAVASFQHFTDLITAENDWLIQPPAGDLPDAVLPGLRNAFGAAAIEIVPVLESTATWPPRGDSEAIGSRETFRLVGVDLIGIHGVALESARGTAWFQGEDKESLGSEAARSGRGEGDREFWATLRNPRGVFISQALSERDGLRAGDLLELVINDRVVALEVMGIIPRQPGQPEAPATLLVLDLPVLQALTGRTRSLTRVEFRVARGRGEAERRAQVREVLEELGDGNNPEHARWLVLSPNDRREAGAVMTRAFRLNLTILSLMALVVGVFLMIQALDGAVVRRRGEIAVLRALGVEERTIRVAWLMEAALLGVVGGVLGALLGWAGAQVAVRFVGRTVNALYYASSTGSAVLSGGEFAGALGLAVAMSLLAGWWPARLAARTPSAQLLARHAGAASTGWALRHPWVGVGIMTAGIVCAWLPPLRWENGVRFPIGGYAAAFLWIIGAGTVGGWVVVGVVRALRRTSGFSVPLHLAASHLIRPSGRHLLAVAGLIAAISMTAGMAILVGSFDRTMRGWIARSLQSDLYISSSGAQSASTDNRISPETWQQMIRHPAVEEANVLHGCEIILPRGATILAAGDLAYTRRHVELAWVEPPVGEDREFDRVDLDGAAPALALISESFAGRFDKRRGDEVQLPTPSGNRVVRVAGVFADYGNERGSLIVDRRYFTNWFGTDFASSVIVKLHDPEAAEEVRAEWLAAHSGLQIFTNRKLRMEVLRIFNQTFAITYAMEAIGMVVAVFGIGMTLASVLLERRSQMTTLRALGMTHGELARSTAIEGVIIAFAGLAAGLLTSLALGWLLIHVINKQTFGWTLQFHFPLSAVLLLGAIVLLAGATVGYVAGRWGANLPAEKEE